MSACSNVLDKVAELLENKTPFSKQSLAEATLRTTIGKTYMSLGAYDHADTHLSKALAIRKQVLGDEHLDTAASMHDLAMVLSGPFQCSTGLGDFARAEPLLRKALSIRRKHPGNEDGDVAESLRGLGRLLAATRRSGEAEQHLREGLEISGRVHGPEHLVVAGIMGDLANELRVMGQREEAEQLAREAFQMRRRLLTSNEHPAIAESLHLLAAMVRHDPAKQEPLERQALDMYTKLLGDDHPLVGLSRHWVGSCLRKLGRYEEAEPELLEALRIRKATAGEDHRWTLMSITELLKLYKKWDEPEAAAEPLREIEALLRRVTRQAEVEYGPDAGETAIRRRRLGTCLMLLRRYSEAYEQLRAAYRVMGDHWTARSLTAVYTAWGKPDPDETLRLALLWLDRGELQEAASLLAGSLRRDEPLEAGIVQTALAERLIKTGRHRRK